MQPSETPLANPHAGDETSTVVFELLMHKRSELAARNAKSTSVARITNLIIIFASFYFILDFGYKIGPYPKICSLITLIFVNAVWYFEMKFCYFGISNFENKIISVEMLNTGRGYNAWTNAYIETRKAVEEFGGRAKFVTVMKFEPAAWVVLAGLFYFLCFY